MNTRGLNAHARVAQPAVALNTGRPPSLSFGEGRPLSPCDAVKADTTRAYLDALGWAAKVANLAPLGSKISEADADLIVAEAAGRLEGVLELIFVVNAAKVRENGSKRGLLAKFQPAAFDKVASILSARIDRHAAAQADQRGDIFRIWPEEAE